MESAFPLDRLSRLTLGTVQAGIPYGIANRRGKPSEAAVREIFDAAWSCGITCFDTARAYGDAEERIGRWRVETGRDPILVSKLSLVAEGEGMAPEAALLRAFGKSCEALGVQCLDGLLAHRAEDLLRPGVAGALNRLRAEGRIKAFGVSVYGAGEIDRVLKVPGIGLIQAPVNAFDRAIVDSGALGRCRKAGVAVFARSVFLQGLFFLDPETLPPHLLPARAALAGLRDLAAEAGCTVAGLALAAVKSLEGVSSVIIGVDSPAQLRENVDARALPDPDDELLDRVGRLGRDLPAAVTNPSLWPK